MDKRLIYTKVKTFNNSFRKEEYKKIPCKEGESNLNDSGDKTFVFNYEKMLAYLPESMIMEQFTIENTTDELILENDPFPAKYTSVKLMFGTDEIESITTSVGEASTIIRTVLTSDTFKKTYGALSGWFPDTSDKTDKTNIGFMERKAYYNGKTTITMFYPLKYLFGLFYNYPKVFYEISNISLILQRNTDDTLTKKIFFGSKLKDETAGPPVVVGKMPLFKTKKLEWWIPVYTPNLTVETFFHNQLNKDKNVEIGFMKNRMAKTTFNTSNFSWTIAEVKKPIRFIYIGFKVDKENVKKNNNFFTMKNIRNIKVSVNGEDYQEKKVNRDEGNVGEAYLSYVNGCEYFGHEPQLTIKDFTNYYPIFIINTTSQLETLNGNSIVVTIEKDGNDEITAFCFMMEEARIIFNTSDHSIKNCKFCL